MSLRFSFIKEVYKEWNEYDDLIDKLKKNPYQKLRILNGELVVDCRNFQQFNRWYTKDNRYTILHFVKKLEYPEFKKQAIIDLLEENYYNDRAFLKQSGQKTSLPLLIADKLPDYSELDLTIPYQKLRILNGKLEIDYRSSWLRTLSNDSRYSVLNFLKNNENISRFEKIRILEYLKKIYIKDNKWRKLAYEFNHSLSVKAQLSDVYKSKVVPSM